MNSDFSTDPRKALEASLAALVLGELPDDQARFLRQAIATDPELAKSFERLKKTTELIRETENSPATRAGAHLAELKLSDSRRQELLQRFKTVQPSEFRRRSGPKIQWLMPVAATVVLAMLLAGMLLPALSRSKSRSQRAAGLSDDLNTLAKLDRSQGINPVGLGAPKQGKASLETDHLTVELNGIESPVSRSLPVGTAASSLTPEESRAASLQETIILPPTEQPESLTLSASVANAEGRNWGFATQPQFVAGDLSYQSPISPNSVPTYNFSGGLGGADAAPARRQDDVPVLGDAPLVGGRFLFRSKDADKPALAETEQVGPGLLNKRDDFKLSESQTAVSGSSYGGGAFGGYSLVAPGGKPAQKVAIDQRVDAESQRLDKSALSDVDLKKAMLSGSFAAAASRGLEEARTATNNPESAQALVFYDFGEAKEKTKNEPSQNEIVGLSSSLDSAGKPITQRLRQLQSSARELGRIEQLDASAPSPATPPLLPQPEVQTRENAFSTFSLNVSDVSFKLATASLEKGMMPEPESIRSEEFINAFDYRDAEPVGGVPVAFAWERAQYPFAQNRDVLRFSIKTAAVGRLAGQPLNIVLLLDNSGSMERADRVQIIHEALRVLASQLQAQDTLSVVTFARTARLWVDGVPGNQAGKVADELSGLTPEGGTNLEEAMNLAYQTAVRHYVANGINRVVLLTDGAANLGDTKPETLKRKVEENRKQGIALDCFGIGWEGYNDNLLEVLTRHGDGRYGFLNTPEQAATEFAGQLAGALHVAASDVKVQVEFNTNRVTAYRQIGYARHQLTQQQFRDNTVDAAEIGAAESGNALYLLESNPQGEGPLATVRVRYKLPSTAEYQEHEWRVPFDGSATPLEQASPAIRLATTASGFSEWLAASPYAAEITAHRLLGYLSGVPGVYGADPRPQKLEWMIRQAKSLSGK